MKKFLFALLPFLLAAYFAQSQTASLQGKVSDDQETLVGATVKLVQGGEIVKGMTTNVRGEFHCIVEPGRYELEVLYTGYGLKKIEKLEVLPGKTNFLEVTLSTSLYFRQYYNGCTYPIPMIRVDETSSGRTFTADQIRHMY